MPLAPSQRNPWLVFCALAVAALAFAAYTDHRWEDYYITYRSSKNLAEGHGLVFSPGDRLHTFTSPLGVLLPAVSYLATGNSSDEVALWIFRTICAAALGGAGVLLLRAGQRLGLTALAMAVPVAGLMTDAKTLDFTINGMETAFMLLFLAYALWAHFAPRPQQWVHLGCAWAGLMWTRPDSFIYVGLIGVGVWLFNRPELTGADRRGLVRLYLRAGLLTTALYLPWLLWAGWYYGTPIPHTIAAKGGISEARSVGGVLLTAVQLPWLAWFRSSSLELTFLPSYYMIGGWPGALVLLSRGLATLAALGWLVPRLHPGARIASFAFFGAHVYLTYFPYFPFPWYIPSTTLLGLWALGGIVQALISGAPATRRRAVTVLAAGLLAGNVWLTWQVARQAQAQQTLVENGVRRPIGEWLRAHAQPGDAVFMEPLGYIGFFSGLKTYDWPGMSSSEMVAARREVGSTWGAILRHLQPRWAVLRPFEVQRIEREAPGFIHDFYEPQQAFDRTAEVASCAVLGRDYLRHDAHFVVFRRRDVPLVDPARIAITREDQQLLPLNKQVQPHAHLSRYNGHDISIVGAPSRLEFDLSPDLSELTGGLGVIDDDWLLQRPLFPLRFRISIQHPTGGESLLLDRELDPVTRPDDRGVRPFRLSLPQPLSGTLRLEITSAGTARAHCFWSELSVVPLRTALDFGGQSVPAGPGTASQFGFSNTEEDGYPCTFAHAPSTLAYPWQPGMKTLHAIFGIKRAAHEGGNSTDGVVFVVEAESAQGTRTEIFRRHLDPAREGADHGPQALALALPPLPGGRILLHTRAAPSGKLDHAWSYWRSLRITP